MQQGSGELKVATWPLRRLFLAEIRDNADGRKATLAAVLDHLRAGFCPYAGFPVPKVERELQLLLIRYGGHKSIMEFLSTDDFLRADTAATAG